MKAPAKTSAGNIAAMARVLIEAEGVERLSMQAIANGLGVRAPPLYKRFHNIGEVVIAVRKNVLRHLLDTLGNVEFVRENTFEYYLWDARAAYFRFVLANPGAYGLLFKPVGTDRELAEAEVEAVLEFFIAPFNDEARYRKYADAFGQFYFVMCHGVSTMVAVDRQRSDEELFERFEDMFGMMHSRVPGANIGAPGRKPPKKPR